MNAHGAIPEGRGSYLRIWRAALRGLFRPRPARRRAPRFVPTAPPLEDRTAPAILGPFTSVPQIGSLVYEATATGSLEAVAAGDGFESGNLGPDWVTFSSHPAGLVDVFDFFAAEGVFALYMFAVESGVSNLNEAIWHVHPDGPSESMLRFSHINFSDPLEPLGTEPYTGHLEGDGVSVSNDGVTWYPVWSPDPFQPVETWQEYTIDLATVAGGGLNLDDFYVKFQQFDALDQFGFRGYDGISIFGPGEPDVTTFTVGPAQTVTVAVTGDASLRPSIQLMSGGKVIQSATAPAAGGKAFFMQPIRVPGTLGGPPVTYELVVSGVGGNTGSFSTQVVLNASFEAAVGRLLASSAQPLTSTFIPLDPSGLPSRAAVLGTTNSSPFGGELDEQEVNNPPPLELPKAVDFAQDLDGAGWNLEPNFVITDSPILPHVSVVGTGDNSFDYYKFTVPAAGFRGVFDIDFESAGFGSFLLDTMLFLYDANGNLIAANDDFFDENFNPDPGSNTILSSLIDFTFPEAGTYVIAVAQYFSFDVGGVLDGTPLFEGDTYTLHVSIEGHALNLNGDDPFAEVEPNHPPRQSAVGFAQNLDGAGWNLDFNEDITDSTILPHVSVEGTGDGTFDYYRFTVLEAGNRGVFDIDYESAGFGSFLLDTMLFLYDANGNFLATNDDFFDGNFDPDPGSNSVLASLIDYRFEEAGTYVIAVGRYFSSDNNGLLEGTPPFEGDAYTLHVSIEGHNLNPGGDDPFAEVEPNNPAPMPPPDYLEFAQDLDAADWVVNTDPNFINPGTIPHLTVHGTGDGSFDYYTFTVPAEGGDVFAGPNSDSLNWGAVAFLFDLDGNFLTSAAGGQFGIFLPGGTYVLGIGTFSTNIRNGQLVGGAPPEGVTYDLFVSVSGHDVVPTTPDMFALDLRPGDPVTISATGLGVGSVGVEVVSRTGEVLATGVAGPSNVGVAIPSFVATYSGTYYLRVRGASAGEPYNLVVTRNAILELEGNDTRDTAQPVTGPQVGGRRWVLGSIDHRDVVIEAFDSGWYNSTGFHDPFNTNYVAGQFQDGVFLEFRNFFVFDVSGISGQVLGAQLNVYNPYFFISPNPSETYSLYDVSTPIDALLAGGPGQFGTFDDLGSGTVYGSYDLSSADDFNFVTVDLNADGVAAAIQADGLFTIGGAVTTLSGFDDIVVFAFSGDIFSRQLLVSVADTDVYRIAADAGGTIRLETNTPGGGAGAFDNTFDPIIRLYDENGNLVASDDNGAADGRNAVLSYQVPSGQGGRYFVEVTSSPLADPSNDGEYVLLIQGDRESEAAESKVGRPGRVGGGLGGADSLVGSVAWSSAPAPTVVNEPVTISAPPPPSVEVDQTLPLSLEGVKADAAADEVVDTPYSSVDADTRYVPSDLGWNVWLSGEMD